MDTNRIAIAALLFVVLILVINLAMFSITRSWVKGGDSRWISALKNTLSKPMENSSHKSMDELREKVKDLQEKKPKE